MMAITTEINSEMVAKCPGCGSEINFSYASGSTAHVCCEKCGTNYSLGTQDPSVLELIRSLGLNVTLDYDESLQVHSPVELTENLYSWFARYQKPIRTMLLREAKEDRMRYSGGPLRGKRHNWIPSYVGQRHLIHIGRACWAVYEACKVHTDTLVFQGYASSRAKALRTPSDKLPKVWGD